MEGEKIKLVTQTLTFNAKAIPKELYKEIEILYELGVADYEIAYLVYLKGKNKTRSKWHNDI